MRLTEKQENIIWHVGNLQLHIQGFATEPYEGEISFEFEGFDIVHPMLEESGMYKVDPVEYYGEAFLNSRFVDII